VTYAQQNAALAQQIRAHTKRDSRSRESAIKALIRKGLFLPDGRPAPEFSNEVEAEKAKA